MLIILRATRNSKNEACQNGPSGTKGHSMKEKQASKTAASN